MSLRLVFVFVLRLQVVLSSLDMAARVWCMTLYLWLSGPGYSFISKLGYKTCQYSKKLSNNIVDINMNECLKMKTPSGNIRFSFWELLIFWQKRPPEEQIMRAKIDLSCEGSLSSFSIYPTALRDILLSIALNTHSFLHLGKSPLYFFLKR